jgi:uncharacterized membrane protein YphA (DoxX/SURF4 family)
MKTLKKVLGAFFVIFGITKIVPVMGIGYGFGGTAWFVGDLMGYPMATTLVTLAIIAEIAGGLALLVPQFTGNCHIRQRYAAYGLAAFTALATVMFHLPMLGGESLNPEFNNIIKNIVIIAALWAVGRNIKQTA